MNTFNWDKFHDWNIGEISIDWEKGVFTINLYLGVVNKVEVTDLKTVFLSRHLPWGMSPYVNLIRCEKNELWEIEIETQSGDIIKIEGECINIQE